MNVVVETLDDAIAEPARPRPQLGGIGAMPADIEAEGAVLGSMLNKPDTIPSYGSLSALSFYSTPHRVIYEAIIDCYEKTGTCDLVGVSSYLRGHSQVDAAGGIGYVTEIATSTPIYTTRRVAQLVASLIDKQRLREVIKQCNGIISECQLGRDAVLETVRDQLLPSLVGAASPTVSNDKDPVRAFDCANATYEQLLAGMGPKGLSTGIRGIDQLIGGLYPKEVTIIAARPGFGKTAIAGTILSNMAAMGEPALFFSLEMGTQSIINRMVCSRARVDASKPRGNTMSSIDMEAYRIAVDRMEEWPLWIDDRSRITVEQMIDTCHSHNRTLARSNKRLKVVAIDYAQLVLAQLNKNSTSENELAHISGMVKCLSKEIDCAVILLSQLNRSSESDGRDDPRMSDLRGSGALEQDADQVAFLVPMAAPSEHGPQPVNLVFKKSRNSTVGEVPLLFERQFTSYTEV
jgi:replicative DNA helicase